MYGRTIVRDTYYIALRTVKGTTPPLCGRSDKNEIPYSSP
jgi:hypothetical protein